MTILRELRTWLGDPDAADPFEEDSDPRMMPSLSGSRTAANVIVTPERSLQIAAVYACVRLIAGTIGTLPIHIVRKDGKRRVTLEDHPMHEVLTQKPNGDLTSGEYWEQVIAFQLLRGNGYAYKEIDASGRTIGLWLIPPTRMEVRRTKAGELAYKVTLQEGDFVPGIPANVATAVPANRIIHHRAFGLGPIGYSPISLARQGIAISFSAEQYGAAFFANNATPGGVIQVPGELSDKSYERLKSDWDNNHRGAGRTNRPDIFENGGTWQSVGLPPEDAQFLQTRAFGVSEIARLLGVPPHLIADVEKSTSWGAGIEQQAIGFEKFCLRYWVVRSEATIKPLLAHDEHLRFDLSGLMRGDMKSRYESYAIGRQWGWLTGNHVLAMEDEEPVDGGDELLRPMNFEVVGADAAAAASVRDLRDLSGPPSLRVHHHRAHAKALTQFWAAQRNEVIAELAGGQRSKDWDERLASALRSPGLVCALSAAEMIAGLFDQDFDPAALEVSVRDDAAAAAKELNKLTARLVAEHTEGLDATDIPGAIRAAFHKVLASVEDVAKERTSRTWRFGIIEACAQVGIRTDEGALT